MPPHRWKKGESGNPLGKPPGTLSLVSELKKILAEIPEGQKQTYARLWITKYLQEGLKGKDKILCDGFDRIDGKAKQAVELSGDPENPIIHQVIWG